MLKDIILFLVGIVVGGMNSIAGGGMLIGFPVLLAAGLPALAANITSNIVVLPGSLSSAYGYRKYIRKVPRGYLLLLLPCLVGALVGAIILRHTSYSKFQHLVPGLILFAVLLFAFQPFLHFHLHKQMHAKTKKQQSKAVIVIISIALLPVAVYGVYFGAGFGFIMLAFLGFTSLHDVHQMNGLKNLAGSVIALMSIVALFSTHLINWHYGLVMALGGVVGGYLGARLSQKVSSHAIRVVVIAIGLTTATMLALRNR
jgi:uncharacterized membrane protein YfcA